MKEQTLTLRPGAPIFIHTPLGTIEMYGSKSEKGYRKIRFQLPPMMRAYTPGKGSPGESDLVTVDGNGKLKPNFSMLVPLTNQDGELVGVVSPDLLKLEEVEPPREEITNEYDTRIPAVADDAVRHSGGHRTDRLQTGGRNCNCQGEDDLSAPGHGDRCEVPRKG